MRQVAQPGTAMLLVHGDAMQPQRAHFGPQVARKFIRAVDLGGYRRNAVLAEAAHSVAQHVQFLAQGEVQCGHGIGEAHAVVSWRRSTPRMILPVAVIGKASRKRTSRG